MAGYWYRWGRWLSRHVGPILVFGGVATLVLALGLPRLEFKTGNDTYLNTDSEVYRDNAQYQRLFGGDFMVVLFTAKSGHSIADLFTPANLNEMRRVENRLRGANRVLDVVSPYDIVLFDQNLITGSTTPTTAVNPASPAAQMLQDAIARDPSAGSKATRTANLQAELTRAQAAGQPLLTNPRWVNDLLFDAQGQIRLPLRPFFPCVVHGNARNQDCSRAAATHAQMLVRLEGNLRIKPEGEAGKAIQGAVTDSHFDGFTLTATGYPVVLRAISDYLQGGMLTLGALAILIMAAVLFLVFRVRWRLLPLLVVLIGVVWAFALLGWIGIPLTLVTISGLPILIGLGVDFAIQIHNRIEEEIAHGTAADPAAEGAARLSPVLVVATIGAIVAFVALEFSRVPMLRQFGILLAIGIAVLCLVGIVVPTVTLAVRERRWPSTKVLESRRIERFVVWLGSSPAKVAAPLVVVSIVLFALGVYLDGQLRIESDAKKWLNPHSRVIGDIRTLDRETGSDVDLGVFVSVGLRTNPAQIAPFIDRGQLPANLSDVERQAAQGRLASAGITTASLQNMYRELDTYGQHFDAYSRHMFQQYGWLLLTESSLTSTASGIITVPGTTHLAPTGRDLTRVFLGTFSPSHPQELRAIRRSLVTDDFRYAAIVFRPGPSSLDQQSQAINGTRDWFAANPPPGGRAVPAGLAVVGVGLVDNLNANRELLTYTAFIGVFIWLALRYRNLVRALLALVPAFLAIGITAIVFTLADVTLSPITTVSGPLVIAVCMEFSVLILARYLEERGRGLVHREAADVAAARTGRAFFATALTTSLGFAVLMASSFPLLRGFGVVTTLSIFLAVLASLAVLPPLMVWFDEHHLLGNIGSVEPARTEPAAAPQPSATDVQPTIGQPGIDPPD